MPVISVLALRPASSVVVSRTLAAVVAGVAEALVAPVDGTWAHFVSVDAVRQGNRGMGFTGHCPIVVVRGAPRDTGTVASVLRAVADAVADGLGVPLEDVWVQWVDVLPGRVFAGGDVVGLDG